MRKMVAGSLLMALGVMLIATVVLVVAAEEVGTCYWGVLSSLECVGGISALNVACSECFEVLQGELWVGWQLQSGSPCVTNGECGATAVTILGFGTPITACNARWAVPSIGAVGVLLTAVGIVVMRRQARGTGRS